MNIRIDRMLGWVSVDGWLVHDLSGTVLAGPLQHSNAPNVCAEELGLWMMLSCA